MPIDFEKILQKELESLEGLHRQNPETGAGLNDPHSFLDKYTTQLFGCPYQLLDSVDRRFEKINTHVGNQFLRNFILNSPILHIIPGRPKYSGKDEDFSDLMKKIYMAAADEGASLGDTLITELGKKSLFSAGKKLQRRMFKFEQDYRYYMKHVNYMCRSMAVFLTLTSDPAYPNGAPSNEGGLEEFAQYNWEHYHWLTDTKSPKASKRLMSTIEATIPGAGLSIAAEWVGVFSSLIGDTAGKSIGAALADSDIVKAMTGDDTPIDFDAIRNEISSEWRRALTSLGSDANAKWDTAIHDTILANIEKEATQVLFMVEPGSYSEELKNNIDSSEIEKTIDGINSGIGQEIAFISGSNVDTSVIGDMASFLGNSAASLTEFVSGLVEPATGGFVHNLFSGAINALKGQKMIYPKIYKSSESSMNYSFDIKLTTPYGDIYNYYMNIIVPLMHLIALAAPKMVSANSVTSPFLVQAFIPGMCTCQMGIITSLNITKNPDTNKVSVHGFPLDVTVKVTIEELYNAMAISPSNDPASFLFNETLNDYMANLGGLMPSIDTYVKQRVNSSVSLYNYFATDEIAEDFNYELYRGLADTFVTY